MVRFVFAAEKASAFYDLRIKAFFDLALFDQFKIRGFEDVPVTFVFFVSIEDFLQSCKDRQMNEADGVDGGFSAHLDLVLL